jgi:hypothetical protein
MADYNLYPVRIQGAICVFTRWVVETTYENGDVEYMRFLSRDDAQEYIDISRSTEC